LATTGESKACRTCKSEKPLEAFAKHRLAKDGYRHDCKSCVHAGKAKGRRELTPEQAAKDKQQRAQPHRRAANRRAVKDWTKRNPGAAKARAALRKAVRRGLVKPAPHCQAKGCQSAHHLEAHHHDYRQPHVVAWLCARHHRRLHHGGHLKLAPPTPQRLAGVPTDLN